MSETLDINTLNKDILNIMNGGVETFGLESYGDVFSRFNLDFLSENLNPVKLINQLFTGYTPTVFPRRTVSYLEKNGMGGFGKVIVPRPQHLVAPMHMFIEDLTNAIEKVKDVETRIMLPLLKELKHFVTTPGYGEKLWNPSFLKEFVNVDKEINSLKKSFKKEKLSTADSEKISLPDLYPTSTHFKSAGERMAELDAIVEGIDLSRILELENEINQTVKYLADDEEFTSNRKLSSLVASSLRKGADELEWLAAILVRVKQVNYSIRETVLAVKETM